MGIVLSHLTECLCAPVRKQYYELEERIEDLEAACTGNFAHIVGSIPATDDEGEDIEGAAIKTVDYSRLVALLWTTVKDLRSRVQELENALP